MAIQRALAALNERIEAACLRCGRNPQEVALMGVSKFHDRSTVEAAWDAGLRLFGESRVQEAERKFAGFLEEHPGTELHLIGALQRNKAKTAAGLFDCVESVDRDVLIPLLGNCGASRSAPLGILLELNAGEASKTGYPGADALCRAAELVLGFPCLRLRGLMTMAPLTDDARLIRRAFRSLALARETLRSRFPEGDWSCLSMGMSGDFETAIEEGSTLVRIGTALFGERP